MHAADMQPSEKSLTQHAPSSPSPGPPPRALPEHIFAHLQARYLETDNDSMIVYLVEDPLVSAKEPDDGATETVATAADYYYPEGA